ncbi:MAG: peptidoglycan recognition family protein [Chloroflexota bacterium]
MEIIGRKAWGARHDNGFGPAPVPADRVWLHHSVTASGAPNSSLAVDTLSVRQLEEIGQARFGRGISYTFAVCPSGRVFEGHSIDRQGAHTKNDNTRGRGIVLVGNYDVHTPTGPALDAVAELLVRGADLGWWRRPYLAGGHRDAPGASTACPGRYAYAAIGAINTAAGRLAAGHPVTPAREEPDLSPEEHAMLVTIHDRENRTQDYRTHHGHPVDDQYGTVLATRREVHDLTSALSAQLSDVQAMLGQLLRGTGASGPAGG